MNDLIKILCIEDDPIVADYIQSLLDSDRFSVSNINDGQKALEFLLSTSNPPDIVLLDYILPSMDGLRILQELNVHHKRYAIVFLTVVETLETAVQAMKLGAVDYLSKSTYLKTELNIKIEKAYQIYQERLKNEYYEERLSMLNMALEQSPNSVAITNTEGNVEYVNKKFTQYTGYTFNEVKGKNLRILKTDSYAPGFYEKLWKTIASGKTWRGEFINRKKNGELFYEKAVIRPIKNKQGDIVSYLGIKEDITELKNAEHAFKESENRFHSIFEMANAGIFFADKNGQIIMVNKAFQEIVEYRPEELMNMDFSQLTHPDDLKQENELLKELILNKINRYRIEKRYVTHSGKTIWADLAVTVINDENGNPVSYVGVVKDISIRKEYEQQLKEIIATKDKFFSIISHDLRNQFSSLLGLTEIIKDKKNTLSPLEKDRFISLLYLSGKNAMELLEDLLKWSRSQINNLELKKEKINLHGLIENVRLAVQNQANLKHIDITSNIREAHEINADRQMISTVLRNLINNAIKFTPSGGQIRIDAKKENQYHIISVADNGVGMPREIAQKLFRIDTKHSTPGTEKEMGTGLGLILCKEFIDKHGGNITVNSEVGKGSEFIISLPHN
jgi:PAS domain S-box-containing protein